MSLFQIWMLFYNIILIGYVLILVLMYDPDIGVKFERIQDDETQYIGSTSSSAYSRTDSSSTYFTDTHWNTSPFPDNKNEGSLILLSTTAIQAMFAADRMILIFFTIELLVRFGTCPRKLVFIKDPFNIIDIVAILPKVVIDSILWAETDNGEDVGTLVQIGWVQVYIKISSVLRVVRLINIARHYIASRVFLLTIWESRKEIVLLLSLYISCATFFAVSVYYCEDHGPDNFPTMASGIWWALITMATVGYGDIYPRSELGKTIGVMCAFSGVIATALPVAVIATNYNIIYRAAKVRARLKPVEHPAMQ